jgi:acyl carrier protein
LGAGRSALPPPFPRHEEWKRQMTTHSIETDIRAFIRENFLFSDNADSLPGHESMLEAGMIDSTGVLELVSFLESHFGISIQDAEIIPGNLDTVDALVAFVSNKVGLTARPPAAA